MRIIAFPFLSFALLVSAAGAADDKIPSGWKEHQPRDKSFTVWLPEKGKVKENESNVNIPGSGFLKIKMASVDLDGMTYSAGTLGLPIRSRKADPGELMDSMRDSFVKTSKGKLSSEKDVKMGSTDGKEYTVETGQGQARLRVFVIDGTIHRIEIAGTKEQLAAKDAEVFLNSYKTSSRFPK